MTDIRPLLTSLPFRTWPPLLGRLHGTVQVQAKPNIILGIWLWPDRNIVEVQGIGVFSTDDPHLADTITRALGGNR